LWQLVDDANIMSIAFDKLTVRPRRRRRLKAAIDGEVIWLRTPLVFQVAPRPLPLLVPARAPNSLLAEVDEGAA
jgi:diacylglycerol kinase family enzyme